MRWGGFSRREIQEANDFERELFGHRLHRSRGHSMPEETVQGLDNRVQVAAQARNPSTTRFPFNTICHVDQGTVNATGTLIAPQVMLTAAHVLRGAASVTITPGANFPATDPADRRPASPSSQVVPIARFRLHPTLDVALALMPAPFTRPTRFMMLQPRGDINTATLLTIAGYPRVAPTGAPIPGSMWRHSDQLPVTGVTPTHLRYPIDTTIGQSGSPLWLLGNDEIRLLLGVHTDGGAAANAGVRITCAVIDWIEATCRAAGITPLPVVDAVQRRRACPPTPTTPVEAPTTTTTTTACACTLGADGETLRARLANTIEQAIATTTPHDTDPVNGQRGPSGLFGSNYDYHSAIHAHWAVLGLHRIGGDAAGSARALGRATEANVATEWTFLQANPTFEQPYGRAWLVLLLAELALAPGRNTTAAQARREAAERQLLEWLESNTARASNDAILGQHGSWLFALLLLVMSRPQLAGAGARIDALYNTVVTPRRAAWRSRAPAPNDFLHVPSILDTLDLLRGQPAAVTATTLTASRIATLSPGHAVGEEMTRLWPIAILARTDPAMCQILRTRLGEWLRHPQHWEFGPTAPASAWTARFIDNAHWTPQFLWMAMLLRC
jgi:V8-like Glu-specific endopeptidase